MNANLDKYSSYIKENKHIIDMYGIGTGGIAGSTGFMAASLANRYDIVKYLIETQKWVQCAPNDSVNIMNQRSSVNGQTAIIGSAFTGNIQLIELLYQLGADINATGFDGASVLYIAAQQNDFHLIEWLLEYGFNPRLDDEMINNSMCNPLGIACNQGMFASVKSLRKYERVNLLQEIQMKRGSKENVLFCAMYL